MNPDAAKPPHAARDPRTLIISQRVLHPNLSRCTIYEMEDVIATVDDVDLAVPPIQTPRLAKTQSLLFDTLERWLGLRVERVPRPEPIRIERDYDLLYFHAENIFDLSALRQAPDWRKRCGVALCRIEEMWLHVLDNARALRALKDFDHVFLGCEQTVRELAKLIDKPVHYLPPATDTLRFCPPPTPPPRTIDCLSIGRRAADLHDALLDHAQRQSGKFAYVFDTREGNSRVSRPATHRMLLADQIQRARYFVVDIAKGDNPGDNRGQQETGYRFFEGAAAGAVLIGTAPDRDSFRRCFDWHDAVIELPGGASAVAARLAELDADPDALQRLSRTNITHSLRRHDYGHRWASMLDHAGIAARPALDTRLARLEQLAAQVEQPPARRANA